MTCKEFEELSGAYALKAVTPEEQKAAELHIAQCRHCSYLLENLVVVTAQLPLALPLLPVQPTATGKARLFEAIHREKEY